MPVDEPQDDPLAALENAGEPELTTEDVREATSTDFPCKICGGIAEQICPQCRQPYCASDASEVDPDFCNTCLRPTDIKIEKKPLVDEEGVTHEGTQITTGGGLPFKTLMQRIVDMDEEKLRTHIQMWQGKVKEAERVLDYRRIALGACQLELEEKEAASRRKLRGIKVTTTGNRIGVSASTSQGTQDAQSKKMVAAMKSLGITDPKQAEAFIKNFGAFIAAQKAKTRPNGGTK